MRTSIIIIVLMLFLLILPAGAKIVGSGTAVPVIGAAGNSSLGGVFALACSGTDKISAIRTDGWPVCSADVNSGGNVSGLGSSGYIPVWTTNSTLNNSVMYQDGESVSVDGNFTVNGVVRLPGWVLGVDENGTMVWEQE